MKKLYQDSTFYLSIFIISYFIYIYPFEILNELLFNEKPNRKSSLLSSLFISILVIFYFRSKNTFTPLKYFIYEGMGIGFISFVIINFFLIFNLFFDINDYVLAIISLISIFILSLIGYYYGNKIFIKKINLKSDKIKVKSKFIFISDIHLGTNSINHLNKIINKLKFLEYDFILIGGDLLDSSYYELNELSVLKQITKPIYFVTGNHEYYLKNHIEKLDTLKNFNIILLDNKRINIKDINLIGISDNQLPNEQHNNYIKLRDNNNYNLLLIHKPSIWDKSKGNVDLMLSGHCHNSQIIFFKIFVRLQFKYIYGLHSFNNSKLYISSGAGCWGPRLRIGTINEIIQIELNPN